MKKLMIVVGTRPNFIKVACMKAAARTTGGMDVRICHTGQHWDPNMAQVFFDELGIEPDLSLEPAGGNPAESVGETLRALGHVLESEAPDAVMAVGDVNSTLAAGLAANKMGLGLCHLESGLRSRDRAMPEEINRIIVDELSDHCFVTEPSGVENLQKEHKKSDQIHFVGNTMIDTLVHLEPKIQDQTILGDFCLTQGAYALMTMHRPSNVDNKEGLSRLKGFLSDISTELPVVFPIHPRTRKRLAEFGLSHEFETMPNLRLLDPIGYLAFQKLIASAAVVLTDSGGIQEETTFRNVPCFTLRKNTERPITVDEGTNALVGEDWENLASRVLSSLKTPMNATSAPTFWDGQACVRVMQVLKHAL